jgi:serine/threonine protein kinase
MSSSSGTVGEVATVPYHFTIRHGHQNIIIHSTQAMATALLEFDYRTTADIHTKIDMSSDSWRSDIKHKAIMLAWGSVTENDEIGDLIAHSLMFELPQSSLTDSLGSTRTRTKTARSLLLAKLADVVGALAFLHVDFRTLHLNIKTDNVLVFDKDANSFEPQEFAPIWILSEFGLAQELFRRAMQRASRSASRSVSELSIDLLSRNLFVRPAGTSRGPEIKEMDSGHADLSSDVWSTGYGTLQVLSFVTDGPIQMYRLINSLPVNLSDKNRRLSISTDGTLVGTAGQALALSTFNMYEHCAPPPKVLEEDLSDVASLISRGDASEAGSSATLVEYQHVATDVIAKAFLGKGDFSLTYSKVIQIVGTDRFLRNNARLLQDFSADLKLEHHFPSETLVARF